MNWGLIAYGRIAKKFMASISTIDKANVTAIASRSNYGDLKSEFPDINIYESYEELYANPNVDIVYISTTHNNHKNNVLLALKAGKHVLCEKQNPALAAGAIWDVGLYPISMAIDVFDQMPSKIICTGFLDENGVDTRSIIVLEFNKGQQAILHCGIDLETIHDGQIFGESQWIHLPNFWHGEKIRIGNFRDNQLHMLPRNLPTSFSYEINACYEAIQNNWIEHPRMSHRHSLLISEVMEECLRQLRVS